jgi:hypothetical protein
VHGNNGYTSFLGCYLGMVDSLNLTNGHGPSSSPVMASLVKPITWYCFPIPVKSVSLFAAFSISTARSGEAWDLRAPTRASIPIRVRKQACDIGPWVRTDGGVSEGTIHESKAEATYASRKLPPSGTQSRHSQSSRIHRVGRTHRRACDS